MTLTRKTRTFTFDGVFSIVIPDDWDYEVTNDVFTFALDDPDRIRVSVLQISFMKFTREQNPTPELAETLLQNYINSTGSVVDDDDKDIVEVSGGPAATFTHYQRADEPMAPNPAPGGPKLWQIWIVPSTDRFAHITHQIENPVDPEDYWEAGQFIAESFEWLHEGHLTWQRQQSEQQRRPREPDRNR